MWPSRCAPHTSSAIWWCGTSRLERSPTVSVLLTVMPPSFGRCFVVGVGLCAFASASEGCAASWAASPGGEAPSDPSSLVGNPAPDFSVEPVSGPRPPASLRALRGQVVLVDFWGTYCGPCRKSFPKLAALSERFAKVGLRVVGISEDDAEDRSKISPFAASYGAKFTIGWDESKAIARKFRLDVLPSSYVIDRQGIVRYAHTGFDDGDEVEIEKEVQALLAQ